MHAFRMAVTDPPRTRVLLTVRPALEAAERELMRSFAASVPAADIRQAMRRAVFDVGRSVHIESLPEMAALLAPARLAAAAGRPLKAVGTRAVGPRQW